MDANPNYKLHATFNKVVNEPKHSVFASNIYLFKVNNKNTRKICEISSKLTTNTLNHPSVFIVNLKHIPHISIVDFEQQGNVSWELNSKENALALVKVH